MLYDTPNQPQFGMAFRRDWEAYREYNLAFAKALAVGSPAVRPNAAPSSRTIT